MSRTWALVTAAVVIGMSAGARAADHEISQKDKAFSAATLKIRAGDRVIFKNDDEITHNVFSTTKGSEFNLRAQAPHTSAPVTFANEGVVEIRCAFHTKMKLAIVVAK